MLFDLTENRKYDTENQQLREETNSVGTTNIDPERDFGMLDCIMNIVRIPPGFRGVGDSRKSSVSGAMEQI